jgi:cytochrome c-type biogenesis protein CcmH
VRKSLFWIALCCVALNMSQLAAKEAPTLAKDPALEAQMMSIAHELRCLVCQNETIAASQADLAVDLREQIREKLQQGETPAEIRKFMVDRYGEFVLYKPRLSSRTMLLWGGPFILLLIGLAVLWRTIRKPPPEPETPMSTQDEERARELLGIAKEKR